MIERKFFIFNFLEGGHNWVLANSREDVVSTYERMNGRWFTIDQKTIRELDKEEERAYWETYKEQDRSKWGKIPVRTDLNNTGSN